MYFWWSIFLLSFQFAFAEESPVVLKRRRSDLSERKTKTVLAIEKARPTVVSITTEVMSQSLFNRFYGGTNSSDGSGVVISNRGIVLTNAHVVEQATSIQASFADGRSYEADIIGIATDLDLAVLRLLRTLTCSERD